MRFDVHEDLTTCRRVFDRVVEQIRGDLLESNSISRDHHIAGRQRNRDAFGVGDIPVEIDRASSHRRERHRLTVERHRAALCFRDVHQRIEHVQHAIGFFDAVGERFPVPIRIRLRGQRHLRRAAKSRQRRPQIV